MPCCFVPGCSTGCSNAVRKNKELGIKNPSLFKAPRDDDLMEKWRAAIPSNNKVLSTSDRICELHFRKDCISRTFETKMFDGTVCVIDREKACLLPGSVPTIFYDIPLLSKRRLKKNQPSSNHSGTLLSKISKRKKSPPPFTSHMSFETSEENSLSCNASPENLKGNQPYVSFENLQKNSPSLCVSFENLQKNLPSPCVSFENLQKSPPSLCVSSENLQENPPSPCVSPENLEQTLPSPCSSLETFDSNPLLPCVPSETLEKNTPSSYILQLRNEPQIGDSFYGEENINDISEEKEQFSYIYLLQHLEQVIKPNLWWTISFCQDYIICAKWDEKCYNERKVIVFQDLTAKIFVRDIEVPSLSMKMPNLQSLSALLFKIDKVYVCKCIQIGSCSNCSGYISDDPLEQGHPRRRIWCTSCSIHRKRDSDRERMRLIRGSAGEKISLAQHLKNVRKQNARLRIKVEHLKERIKKGKSRSTQTDDDIIEQVLSLSEKTTKFKTAVLQQKQL